MKQTMGHTEEGHAQVLASLRDTGGTQVSHGVARQCVFVPLAHSFRLPEEKKKKDAVAHNTTLMWH